MFSVILKFPTTTAECANYLKTFQTNIDVPVVSVVGVVVTVLTLLSLGVVGVLAVECDSVGKVA